jgi:transcriptional regulator with XRE-family HTH domain
MTTYIESRDQAVARVRDQLRRLVRASGKTQRAIEEENGFSHGYLSQVFGGNMTLTVRHVFGILLSLGESPAVFFAQLFPEEREAQHDLSEIRERMNRYDDAFRELEAKGLLTSFADDEEPTDPEPRD